MLDKQGEIVREIHLQTISMIERVQEPMLEDILLNEEPMSVCLPLLMILTSQSTPNLLKIHPLLIVFLTPSCGGSMYFIDYLDTQPPIPFMLICFVAGSPRVVDYITLHRRKALIEHTECRAKDIEN